MEDKERTAKSQNLKSGITTCGQWMTWHKMALSQKEYCLGNSD